MRRSVGRLCQSGKDGRPLMFDQQGLIHPESLGFGKILARLHEKFLYERNFTVRAPFVQWKRDWTLVGDVIDNNERIRNGMEPVEKEKTRWETTWRCCRARWKDTHKILIGRVEEGLRAIQKDNFTEKFGYNTEIKESSLLNENRSFHHKKGLFAKGKIPQGEIVGMIPGVIWQGYNKLGKTNPQDSKGNAIKCSPYIYNRNGMVDGTMFEADLDAYPNQFKEFTPEEVRQGVLLYHSNVAQYVRDFGTEPRSDMSRLEKQTRKVWSPIILYIFHRLINRNLTPYLSNEDWAPRAGLKGIVGLKWDHSFSHANYINHCGVERLPNVILIPVSLPVQFPKDLLPYVPNRVDPPVPGDSVIRYFIYDDYHKCMSRQIVQNQKRFGSTFTNHGEAQSNQFLYLINTLVAVTIRDVEDGEELVTNLRFPLRRAADFPLSYTPAPGFEVEDSLHHNTWPKETSFFKRLLGIYDPNVSVVDGLRDTRLMDRDFIYRIGRLFGIK